MTETVECWDCGATVNALNASAAGVSSFECDNCRDRARLREENARLTKLIRAIELNVDGAKQTTNSAAGTLEWLMGAVKSKCREALS